MEDNMAGILNKLMDFIGIEDVDDEGYNEDYFNDEQQSMAEDNVVSLGNRGRRKTAAGNNVVSLPTAAPMKMVVYHPVSYEDTQNIIDNLRAANPLSSIWKSLRSTAHSAYWTSWRALSMHSMELSTRSPAVYSS